MKKLFAIVIIVFGLQTLSAQSNFRLGLTFSPNVSWIDPDTRGVAADGNRLGFKYGVIADFNFAENYAFSSGIFLTHTGGSVSLPSSAEEANGAFGNLNSEMKLQYLEIPLSLKLRTNEIGYMKYFGQIGLGTAINIGARSDLQFVDLSGNEVFNVEDESISDDINLFMMNLIIGAGVEYNVSGNTAIMVGLSFHNGFTNIFDFDVVKVDRNGNFLPGETQKAKGFNNYISLDLGVLF